MIEFSHPITLSEGMHTRPAGGLVKLLNKFESDIQIGNGQRFVNGKQLMALFSLDFKCGDIMQIKICGKDEVAAQKYCEDYLLNNL